jgi:hypothetical protein
MFPTELEPALESRVVLSTTTAPTVPPTGRPDDWRENVIGGVEARVDYNDFTVGPYLVFLPDPIAQTSSLNIHDSAVPFVIDGFVSGPALLEITNSRNDVTYVPISGAGIFQQFYSDSTVDKLPGDAVTIRARLLTPLGRVIDSTSASDTVLGEDV